MYCAELLCSTLNMFILTYNRKKKKGKLWKLSTELNLEDVLHNRTQQY